MQEVPVLIANGNGQRLSTASRNQLPRAIIKKFLPRFSRQARVLYARDKPHTFDQDGLAAIGMLSYNTGDSLPGIVAYEAERNWAFLIEAVPNSAPIDEERLASLRKLTSRCTAGHVFVTAFLTRSDFKKWVTRVAWETEVWIAESPDHMIHFNGERFLGPYELPEQS